jgi:cytochrome P450
MAGIKTTWALAAAGCIAFLTYRYIIYPLVLSPLAKIPNAHWSVPLSRFWVLRVRFTRRENRTLHEVHQRLGAVVRLGPNEISVSDIEGVRTVYQGGFEKPEWYSVFDNYGYEHVSSHHGNLAYRTTSVPCMFSTRGSREHSARKKMMSHVYSKTYINSSPAFSAQASAIIFQRFLPILEESTMKHQVPHGIDIYSTLMAVTMDFITAYIFGLRDASNFLQNVGYRDHFLELYKSRSVYGVFDQELPRITAFCRKLGIPLCPKWVDWANQEMAEWCRDLCKNTAKTSTDEKARSVAAVDEPVVWNSLLSGFEKERNVNGKDSVLYPTALTQQDLTVSSELFDHVLAGHETSGLALTYLTWRLSQSLALQHELRAELLTLAPNMKLERGKAPSLPDPKGLDGLPILHAVIMETLRLHAPIPGAQPRQTQEPSCRIGGFDVPGGVRVAATAYSLHREESIFPEPKRWDHTRWLASHATEDERRQRNRQFWAFSSGGRMCIGSNFAMHGRFLEPFRGGSLTFED